MTAIKTTALTKKYKTLTAVDNLDLEIFEGELFSLLGTNGAGKTTTIRMLSCLAEPTSGDATIGGFSIKDSSALIKDVIGISLQDTAIAPNLTARENIEFIAALYGFNREKQIEKINELTELFDLSEILAKPAGRLSGGWQRRLSIAMALVSEPKILFLDEPTLGIDVIARSEIWDIIRSLKGKTTIILTTHYMEEAEALSDRIGIMNEGRLIALGTARELMDSTGSARFEDAFISIVKGDKR